MVCCQQCMTFSVQPHVLAQASMTSNLSKACALSRAIKASPMMIAGKKVKLLTLFSDQLDVEILWQRQVHIHVRVVDGEKVMVDAEVRHANELRMHYVVQVRSA